MFDAINSNDRILRSKFDYEQVVGFWYISRRFVHFLKGERVVEPSCSFGEADVNRVCFQRESMQ